MRAKYFSTTALTIAVIVAGLVGALRVHNSQTVYAHEDDGTNHASVAQAEEDNATNQNADITVPENYSYTVQPGDGVTHMILDLAQAVGLELTPGQAYDVARNTGSVFLDENITVESDAPYTNGIGGFPEPGVVVAANQHPNVFERVGSGTNSVVRGETPAPAEGTDELPTDSSNSDDVNDDEAADLDNDQAAETDDDSGLSPLAVVLGVIGIAAVAYYAFGRTRQE